MPAIPCLRRRAMRYLDIPKPVLFHPLKHHLGYIREFISSQYDVEEEQLKAWLRTIGSSQPDLYLGKLTPPQIADETSLYLQQRGALEREAYRLYLLASGSDYRMITLSDGSTWVLRWGLVAERHMHLHPARYSQHTTRVKANVLKTVIAALLAMKRMGITELNLALINRVRTQWLDLAPLKHYKPDEGLGRMINLLIAF